MGLQNLQAFIEANCPNACVPVDLLKIARGLATGKRQGGSGPNRVLDNRLCLVIDGECCLDRLYGGYYSDWACGGQWNRMLQFLSVLMQTIHTNNIEIVMFFNGSLEPQRMEEWIKLQLQERKKITQIMKHVNVRATPPPKVWWFPPVCLRTCLRMALRNLNVPVVCSMDDHHQEVIAYCRENYFHGVIAEDVEYAIFDPPRYFSSSQLKLTYKGSLETKEFIIDEVAKELNLHPKRFCIFAALLGNYLLNEEDLASFYQTLSPDVSTKTGDGLIKAVVGFVRSLPNVENVDAIGAQVFVSHQNSHEKIQKFKECVQYYLNGTKEGFLRYRPPVNAVGRRVDFSQFQANLTNVTQVKSNSQPKITIKQKESSSRTNSINSNVINTVPSEAAKFASETEESEMLSLNAYKEATESAPSLAPDIVIEPPNAQLESITVDTAETNEDKSIDEKQKANGGTLLSSSTSSSSSDSSPIRVSPEVATWPSNSSNTHTELKNTCDLEKSKASKRHLPKIPPEVMRTASERHQKGLMSPWIYQILTQGEIKIPVAIEEDVPKELPSGVILFRPLREMVYAILFNIHHMNYMAKSKGESEDSVPEILIKEWVWSKANPYKSEEIVRAVQLGWKVPTVQRLWFGSVIDDKRRRMRAFLTCLRSDTPLMLKTTSVPQHLLILCCVLRYMLSDNGMRVLRRQELDAFLAQAVSPQLMDSQGIQLMQLPLVTNRGIQLASLFMQGVEHALLANDACGAPIPLLMCSVWLFFDGKLFHEKLLKAHTAKNLSDICDGQLDQVVKVDRMRAAILENMNVVFARPPIGIIGNNQFGNMPTNVPPPSTNAISRGRGKKMYARGGQLEIAGVVVGSWGANYGQVPARGRGLPFAPAITPANAPRRPGGMNVSRNYPTSDYSNRYVPSYVMGGIRGRRPGGPALKVVGKQGNKKKNNSNKGNRTNGMKLPAGRGCSLEISNGNDVQHGSIQNGLAVEKYEDAVEKNSSSQLLDSLCDDTKKMSTQDVQRNSKAITSLDGSVNASN